jgi:two-component system NtrC family sensor kinase
MTSTMSQTSTVPTAPPQHRPTGAKLRTGLSLRARLALLVALSTAVVIGLEAYLETRVFERAVRSDLIETARLTALAVADDYELRPEPVDITELSADLHELVLGTPSLRTLTIVQVGADTSKIVASTSSGERPETLVLGERAVRDANTTFGEGGPAGLQAVAVPLTRPNGQHAAAIATLSLGSLDQLRTKGRLVALWFTPAAIILLTLLVDWLGRRYIHIPIGRVRDTMARAGAGDVRARADVLRDDEIGSVAVGLNDMLQRLQDLHLALQERVEDATAELRVRNEELVESYQRVFVLREALARAEQMAAVGQMAASVAHQVGTPLNLISGHVQMMQQEESADPRSARRLEIVQEQIAKVASVVRTLLDQSHRRSDPRPTDVGPLLSRVADVARPKLDATGITLTLDAAPDLPVVLADAEELELAILNLVTNSLDAMPGGGTLTIRSSRAGEVLRIDITDTGSGIAPDLLPRIFEPWVTTKPAGRGTGLGLSITRDVVARIGGTITVTSEPGRLTTFTIELPGSAESTHVQNSDR